MIASSCFWHISAQWLRKVSLEILILLYVIRKCLAGYHVGCAPGKCGPISKGATIFVEEGVEENSQKPLSVVAFAWSCQVPAVTRLGYL